MNRLILLVESRIRGDVYIRFGGEYPKTHRRNTAERQILSLLIPTSLNQLCRGMVFNSIDEVKTAVTAAVDFYNNERPHMSIDMMTPREAAEGCTGEIAKRWKSYRFIAIKNRQVD